jgi:hypothetical protein
MSGKALLSPIGFYFLTLIAINTMGCQMEIPKIKAETRYFTAETFYFEDDGRIPNSKYPLLLYRDAFSERDWLELLMTMSWFCCAAFPAARMGIDVL